MFQQRPTWQPGRALGMCAVDASSPSGDKAKHDIMKAVEFPVTPGACAPRVQGESL